MDKKYLTERALVDKLSNYIDKDLIIHNKKFLSYRPDIRVDSLKLIIEFDGYRHYNNSNIIIKDYQKDIDYKTNGYRIVRIPYFIQWCNELVTDILNKQVTNIIQEYPHGFIDEKAMLPADFCWLGIQRFKEDWNKFNYAVPQIKKSILSYKKDINLVIPNPIQYLIN